MGVVYEATQTALDRKVALKVLGPGFAADDDLRARFRREGLAQAAVDHPHIVTVHDAAEAEGQPFIAMRLIHGPTLKDLIRSGELGQERALALLAQVADALDAAHRAGLVHRDVKPANILVGPGDHAYLADFGISKILAETAMTSTGQLLGTPHYIAPEQVDSSAPPTPAADVYALAAVAYECLTGKTPFQRDTNQAVLFAHVYDTPRPASETRPGISPAVDAALARGLAKAPEDRPASAGALIAELTGATRVATRASPAPPRPAEPAPAAAEGRKGSTRMILAAVAGALVLAATAVLLLGGENGDSNGDRSGGVGNEVASGAETVGSRLDNPDHQKWTCQGEPNPTAPCTLAQTELAEGPTALTSDGKVVKWRVVGAKGSIALVVLRPGGGKKYVRAASSGEQTVPDTELHSFATDLEVRKGDLLGLQLAQGAHVAAPYVGETLAQVRWLPILGTRPAAPEPPQTGYELLYNADVAR